MKKAHSIYLSLAALVSLGLLFSSGSGKRDRSIRLFQNHASSCFWNHYSSLPPNFEDNGLKEYYVCCDHHDFVFERPLEGSVSDPIVPDRGFANGLPSDDVRVILSYSKQISRLQNEIEALKKDWDSRGFSVFEDLNECFMLYADIEESYRNLVTNYSDLLFLQSDFDDRYDTLLSASDFDLKGREYGMAIGKRVEGEDSLHKKTVAFQEIVGADTFWGYCDSELSLENYSTLEFYAKASMDCTLEFRAKKNYSKILGISLAKDVYSHVSFPLENVSSFGDIGFAIWFGKSYSIDSLTFTSFYASRKEKRKHAALFDASKDEFVCNDYISSFNSSHETDGGGESVYSVADISSKTDWVWLKPDLSFRLTGYSAIYFRMKSSKDAKIELRETSTGQAKLLKIYSLKAETWVAITLEVNDSSFPSGNLNNLGIGNYSEGGHPLGTVGVWSFGNIYGIRKEASNGYEVVDDIAIPSFKKEGAFDITAYGVNKLEEGNADKILSGVADAGFSKIIPLYNGRNGDLEGDFGSAINSYNSAILSLNKEKYKKQVLSIVDRYMESIKGNNSLILSEARKKGISVVDFIGFIYDFESILEANGVINLKASIYKEVMAEFLSKIDYAGEGEYAGLFLKDEPNAKNDFSTYKAFAELYGKTYSLPGCPFLNLLPLGEDGSSKVYQTYLDRYFESLYPSFGYASFDQYPVKRDGSILSNHLRNLEDFAGRLKGSKEIGELKTFIHSANEDDGIHDIAKINDENDLLFQMYSSMAFGSREMIYFTYSSHSNDLNGLVSFSSGDPTPLYDYAKKANEEILSFAPYYSYFDFNGVFVSGGASQFSLLSNGLSGLDGISSISSSFDLLAGEFKQGDDYGYLLMNYGNPSLSKDASSLKLSFEEGDNYALVFENGAKHLEKLSKGTLELNVPKGKAAFVIPLAL